MKEYSLKYHFFVADISKLKPGDALSSPITPNPTFRNPPGIYFSPAGVPFHFSLHLIYVKMCPVKDNKHRFRLQLRVHLPEPSFRVPAIPYLPSFHVQPLSGISRERDRGLLMDKRLLGPQQPASWAFPMTIDTGLEMTGRFCFRLLDEPMLLLANPTPVSETDWSSLPLDMVSAVLRELPLVDRVNARLVCKEWASVLDKDSQAWTNVTFLESITADMKREEAYGYDGGQLNQVRDYQLFQALRFLSSRKAPIRSLELTPLCEVPYDFQETLTKLQELLSHHDIELTSFALRNPRGFNDMSSLERGALRQLLENQPRIERLYLEVGPYCISPSIIPRMPRLRILSLAVSHRCLLRDFQNKQRLLAGLDGLRLLLYGDEEAFNFDPIEKGTPLRRVDRPYWYPGSQRGRGSILVWGTEALSSSSAAYLLTPIQMVAGNGHQLASHHCI